MFPLLLLLLLLLLLSLLYPLSWLEVHVERRVFHSPANLDLLLSFNNTNNSQTITVLGRHVASMLLFDILDYWTTNPDGLYRFRSEM
jgi:hypothetical protein